MVDVVNGKVAMHVEPLALTSPCKSNEGCDVDEGCQVENEACQSCESPKVELTVLERNKDRVVAMFAYEFNGTRFEVNFFRTTLWRYEEFTDAVNRTAFLFLTETVTENASTRYYSLGFAVQHSEFVLYTLSFMPLPPASESYATAFTLMNYIPRELEETRTLSLEAIKFESAVLLSEHYGVLGKVSRELGNRYEKSRDTDLRSIAKAYKVVEKEARLLSKLVEKQLQTYNLKIVQGQAALTDSNILGDCWLKSYDEFEPLHGGGSPPPPSTCDWGCLIGCALQDPQAAAECTVSCYACFTGFIPLCVPCLICILAYCAIGYLCALQCGCV